MKLICSFSIPNLAKKQCSYRDFLHWGPIEKLKGGHEGEKRVIVYEYILQDDGASERIISHMSIRRSRHFMDAADWVFRKVAIKLCSAIS